MTTPSQQRTVKFSVSKADIKSNPLKFLCKFGNFKPKSNKKTLNMDILKFKNEIPKYEHDDENGYINKDMKKVDYIDHKGFTYDVFPDDKILEKVDYFITPYNNKIDLRKHMGFKEEVEQRVQTSRSEGETNRNGNKISNLIIEEKPRIFKLSIAHLNKDLWNELRLLADKTIKNDDQVSKLKINKDQIGHLEQVTKVDAANIKMSISILKQTIQRLILNKNKNKKQK